MDVLKLILRPLAALTCLLALLLVGTAPVWAQQTATAAGASPSQMIASGFSDLRHHVQAVVYAVPEMPRYLADAVAVFRDAAARAGGTGIVLLDLLACLIAGVITEWVFRRVTTRLRARLVDGPARTISDRLVRFGIDALLRFTTVLAFSLGQFAVLLIVELPGPIHEAGIALLVALLWVRIALASLYILLRPADDGTRTLAALDLDLVTAQFWQRHLATFIGWFAFGWATTAALHAFGMPVPGLQFLAYVLGIGLVVIALDLIWRRPADAPRESSRLGHTTGRWLASIATVTFWFAWTTSAMYLFWFLVVSIFMPLAIAAARRAARHLMRPTATDDAPAGLMSVAPVFVDQGLRALAIVGGILILLWGWKLDVGSLAAQENAVARLVRGGLHALIVLLAADLVWNLFKALADNALTRAEPAPGVAAEEARRRARVRTLLPIGRNLFGILLLVMAALMALSALGVEIAPLIASAGVVGVAVGFGSQTIVRDIISGMFYMLDDAFRVGEYIQSGSYKGTVESFSLRSVKLRHQRGPLFTIPFGVLGAVQNMSRDWVMVKDQIGITYDSDVDKAKKLIKQIGLELAKDPDLGPSILQPLKMQGIEQVGKYSIDIRMKMMCKPGEQFMVRRRANAMIKKAFDENGIKFAFPTVQLAGGGEDNKAAAAAAQQILEPAVPEH